MAESLIGSEIIKLAAEVNEKIKKGEPILNFTIGDFDPEIFPIPEELEKEVIAAYRNKQTNYPMANGIPELRREVSNFLTEAGIHYSPNEILITSGGRPAIYAAYLTLIQPGDSVIFAVPSWNNNHYCHLSGAQPIMVEATRENGFMPVAEQMRPHIKKATLLALCSPQNPTGTTFSKEKLSEICDLVLEENERRGPDEKPLYVLYDQMYWLLTYGETVHHSPVTVRPEMKHYTIFIDGISKSFAATGLRVGWAFGPQYIIDKMKSILSHIGAWAPKPEQVAVANYLKMKGPIRNFLSQFREQIDLRLEGIYKGFMDLKKEGHKVDAIAPEAALYLTVQVDLKDRQTADGRLIKHTEDVTEYLLNECGIALVPFYAFGSSHDSTWYRLSVGTCKLSEIEESITKLRKGLEKLK
ncbi:MAG: aminotransferase class I/II-fold pyridoxal phosphate-dependent enzyme [Chitinophagales bacterium]|nr:aminotransferase class I/II-fold pyridoxal phosphate-dependent enzyme [Chitinophagales bacterium]